MTGRLQARLRVRLTAAREVLALSMGPERVPLSAVQADAAIALASEARPEVHLAGPESVVSMCDLICAVPWEASDRQASGLAWRLR